MRLTICLLVFLLDLLVSHNPLDPIAFITVCPGEIRSELEDKASEMAWLIHRYSNGIETDKTLFNNRLLAMFDSTDGFEAILLPNDIFNAQPYYVFLGI